MRPFQIRISDERIEDLEQRLRNTGTPGAIFQPGPQDGASLEFMQRLLRYWLQEFDWRAQEARLNQLPQFMSRVDGQDIHFVHQKGSGPDPLPLILTHG